MDGFFGDFVGEIGASTGTGDYSMGGAFGSNRTWRSVFTDGAKVGYLATTRDAVKRELGFGVFSIGTPDKLARNVQKSTQGDDPVDWQPGDVYYLYSVPIGEINSWLMNGGLGADDWPEWAVPGLMRLDSESVDDVWIKTRRLDDATDSEEGRHHIAAAIFAASQRTKYENKGAADYLFTADDVGKVLGFDVSAGVQTLTMLAHDADGMGHSAYVYVYPFGSKVNGVTFTPGGADTTTIATIPPGRATKMSWDGARSTWIADYSGSTPVLRSYLAGLGMANNTGTPNTKIDVAAGQCADSTNALMMSMAGGTIDCGTTGANGLDTGALANTTTYHVFAIAKATDGTTALLASMDPAAPTMPSGYTLKRRIGSFRTDGSAHIIAFVQDGDLFQLKATALDIDVTNPGNSAVTRTLSSVPTGVNLIAILNLDNLQNTNPFQHYVSDLATNDEAPSQTAAPLASIFPGPGTTQGGIGPVYVRTDTSAQIRSRCTNAGASDIIRVATLGWIDRRGRDA